MKLIILFFVLQLLGFKHSVAQNITIPDNNFLKALINLGLDINHDGKIQSSEAVAVKSLTISSAGITDLSGIEAFVNLDTLDCSINQLNTLDLSHNTKLTLLYCSINKLTTIDLSKNSNLTYLSCSNNKLTNLTLSNNSKLILLDCGFNKQTKLDLSMNANLEILECYSNQLDSLNLSQNSTLISLYCGSNKITSLDLSKNLKLKLLDCQFNQLHTINLSKNALLAYLACYSNQLTNLDVTKNIRLTFLDIGANLYANLDLSKNDSLHSVDCSQNPNLKYICVKDTMKVMANMNFYKDADAKWTENCNQSTEVKENQKEIAIRVSPNPSSEYFNLFLQTHASIKIFNSMGTEIESFKNVQNIQFGQNYLPALYFVVITMPGKSKQVIKIIKE